MVDFSSPGMCNKNKLNNPLNTGLVWYLNGRFVSCCEMVLYSNGGLKTGLKKPVQNVWYLNGPPSQVTLPLEHQTLILSGIQIYQVLGIQMVTVPTQQQSKKYFLQVYQHLGKHIWSTERASSSAAS